MPSSRRRESSVLNRVVTVVIPSHSFLAMRGESCPRSLSVPFGSRYKTARLRYRER